MKIVKINISVRDVKYTNYNYSLSAISTEAAIKYLEKEFAGLVDRTDEFLKTHPYVMETHQPIKIFEHTKSRYDEDGAWDYPIESEIILQWEEVIE